MPLFKFSRNKKFSVAKKSSSMGSLYEDGGVNNRESDSMAHGGIRQGSSGTWTQEGEEMLCYDKSIVRRIQYFRSQNS